MITDLIMTNRKKKINLITRFIESMNQWTMGRMMKKQDEYIIEIDENDREAIKEKMLNAIQTIQEFRRKLKNRVAEEVSPPRNQSDESNPDRHKIKPPTYSRK